MPNQRKAIRKTLLLCTGSLLLGSFVAGTALALTYGDLVEIEEFSIGEIQIVGSRLYFAHANYNGGVSALKIYDIESGGGLTFLGENDVSDEAFDVDVSGNYAYVADRAYGLRVIDVSDPTQPVAVGLFQPVNNEFFRTVAVKGNVAYTGSYSTGLSVIDASDPALPDRVSTFDDGDTAEELVTKGNRLYAIGSNLLRIYDISDRRNPVRIGEHTFSSSVSGIDIVGTRVYATQYFDAPDVQILDVSDPTSISVVSSHSFDPEPVGEAKLSRVVVSDDLVYLSGPNLRVLDMSNLAEPVPLGLLGVEFLTGPMKIRNGFAYIGVDNQGIRIVNLSNPFYPRVLSRMDWSFGAHDVRDDRLYTVNGNHFEIYDVSDPNQPSLIGDTDDTGFFGTTSVKVVGDYTYVTHFSSHRPFEIFDVSDPTDPVRVLWPETNQTLNATNIEIVGSKAYVVGLNSLAIFDLSNPADPTKIYLEGDFKYNGNHPFSSDVEIAGDYAFIGGQFSLVYDVSNPALPTFVSEISSTTHSGLPRFNIEVYNNLAYISRNGPDGLEVFDITNPAFPVRLGGLPGAGADVNLVGSFAVDSRGNSFRAIDVSNPTNPKSFGSIYAGANFVGADVNVANGLVYASARISGQFDPLWIFEFGPEYPFSTLSDANNGGVPRITSLNDLNGDNHTDIGVLLRSQSTDKNVLSVESGANGSTITSTAFGSERARGSANVADANGDLVPEFGVLLQGSVFARVKDVTNGTTLGKPTFKASFDPIAFLSIGDVDGNPGPDVAVVGRDHATGRVEAQVKDVVTGQRIRTLPFNRQSIPFDAVVLDNVGGSPAPEIAVLGIDGAGTIRAQIKDAATGQLVNSIKFNKSFTPIAFAAVPNANGDLKFVAVLGKNAAGVIQAQIKRAKNGKLVRNIRFSKNYVVQAFLAFEDSNGNGSAEISVVGVNETGVVRAQTKEVVDGSLVSNFNFNKKYFPVDSAGVNSVAGTGRNELAVLGRSSSGEYQLQVRDLLNGDLVLKSTVPQ